MTPSNALTLGAGVSSALRMGSCRPPQPSHVVSMPVGVSSRAHHPHAVCTTQLPPGSPRIGFGSGTVGWAVSVVTAIRTEVC